MKIKYIKSRIKYNLGFGFLMICVGLFALYEDHLSALGYIWVFFGALQAGTALYAKKNQYLTINNEKLTKHSIIPKSVEINKIRKVRRFANSYKIETPEKTITIDKGIIENESLFKLEDYFNKLKINA